MRSPVACLQFLQQQNCSLKINSKYICYPDHFFLFSHDCVLSAPSKSFFRLLWESGNSVWWKKAAPPPCVSCETTNVAKTHLPWLLQGLWVRDRCRGGQEGSTQGWLEPKHPGGADQPVLQCEPKRADTLPLPLGSVCVTSDRDRGEAKTAFQGVPRSRGEQSVLIVTISASRQIDLL